MKHSIQKIIKNQNAFSEQIKEWLEKDFSETKKTLKSIDEKVGFIKKEKEALINKLESLNVKNFISSLFFLNSKRSENFYAWWEEELQEVIIYRYASKKRRNRKTPTQY